MSVFHIPTDEVPYIPKGYSTDPEPVIEEHLTDDSE